MADPLIIMFALFPGLTQLDFSGPHEVLSRTPGTRVVLASAQGGEIRAESGLVFAGVDRLADLERCDVICVPKERVKVSLWLPSPRRGKAGQRLGRNKQSN